MTSLLSVAIGSTSETLLLGLGQSKCTATVINGFVFLGHFPCQYDFCCPQCDPGPEYQLRYRGRHWLLLLQDPAARYNQPPGLDSDNR